MSAAPEMGQSWSLLWGPEPDQPYATLECSPVRGTRWAHEELSATGQSRVRCQWATAVGRARLDRELTLVAGDQVAVLALWVLRAWVDAHFVCCERPWVACLDAIVGRAESEGRAVRITDLPELAHAGAGVRWAARASRPALLHAHPWFGPPRATWHEAGHAMIAWHHQDRYEPLIVDLTAHLGGLGQGALANSPQVAPARTTDVGGGWDQASTFVHGLWLSAGIAAESVLFPHLMPTGDKPPPAGGHPGGCNAAHLQEAARIIGGHREQAMALSSYMFTHSGASRRHLARLLGPRVAAPVPA